MSLNDNSQMGRTGYENTRQKKKDHLSSLDKENQYEGESFKSRQKS